MTKKGRSFLSILAQSNKDTKYQALKKQKIKKKTKRGLRIILRIFFNIKVAIYENYIYFGF
jgi:hypothetical protein